MEKTVKSTRTVHLAGVIPVAAPPLEFKMPWHDCLMPIGPDYLAIERAVTECVYAGCSTIWICCHIGMQPLLKSRVGETLEWIYDSSINGKLINVYYVPVHTKDKGRRDCLGWSALYAADSAFRVSAFMSKWVAPEKYYCAFPYGISPVEFIKDNSKIIKKNKKVLFSSNGKTVKDGLHTSFTFDADDYKRCRDIVKKYNIEKWNESEGKFQKQKALYMELNEVFAGLASEDAEIVEYPWFHEINTWDKYCSFMGSGIKMERHKNLFKKIKRVGIDE